MPHDNSSRSRTRRQFAVYWKKSGTNELGEATVDSPVELKVRIEEGLKETLDNQGNTIASSMELNVPEDIVVGSLFWLGKLIDLPSPVPEVLQVIDYAKIPSTGGRRFDRRVKLMKHSNKDPVLT